jgi:hypothetical protein
MSEQDYYAYADAGGPSRYELNAVIDKALDALSGAQDRSGAFGDDGESFGTANVVRALSALGVDCDRDDRFCKSDGSALDALLRRQLDSGAFTNDRAQASVKSGVEAILALKSYAKLQEIALNR